MLNFPRLVVAGLRGGSGKTMLSLGLARAFTSKGLRVVPFKKGPDYIDAGWLASAARYPCYNLDPFMIGSERLLSSFISHAEAEGMAIVEGNRGLFDGMDEGGSYSTAEVARIIQSPVILIIDCTKVTRTVASMVLGAKLFDEQLMLKGVVLNRIAGARHESVIRKSIDKYCGIPVLGAIPRFESGEFPERHMGLTPHVEHPDTEKAISFAADAARRYLDLDKILAIAKGTSPLTEVSGSKGDSPDSTPPLRAVCKSGTVPTTPYALEDRNSLSVMSNELKHETHHASPITHHGVRIGVVRDSAFQFYYPENFEELRRHGAEIIEISALTAKQLPGIDALYIGGGFPETHAIALAENTAFRDSLRMEIEEGLPVYAECGGLMYLGKELLLEGKTYPMAGIFPFVFSLEKRPHAHGYSIVEAVNKNPFFPKGTILRGHEFHYSNPFGTPDEADGFSYAFKMNRGKGISERKDGICYKNVLATYTHLHAIGAPEWVEGMIRQAEDFAQSRHLRQKENEIASG